MLFSFDSIVCALHDVKTTLLKSAPALFHKGIRIREREGAWRAIHFSFLLDCPRDDRNWICFNALRFYLPRFYIRRRIPDNYTSWEEVIEALQKANLESSNLIIGIDFTKSNEWKGKQSFNGLSLHHIGETKNPYEQAISCIGNTLSNFDEDNKIPCFGFGDASTKDKDVFSFYPDGRACNGIAEVQARYRELVPDKKLSGPTSFAPIINKAVDIVIRSGSLYHVLLIIADGQVSSSYSENLSYQEECTKVAIQRASNFPLSIVLVGVGDGPWDLANNYDNFLHSRHFDNFQFVNFTEIMSMNMPDSAKEAQFALQALMEIPLQYAAIQGLGILGTPPRRSIPQISGGSGFESVVETFDHPVVHDANQEIRSMPQLARIQGGLHRVQSNRFRRGSGRISRAVSSFSRLLGLNFRFLGTETDDLEETDELER
ncbi:E3 ubiquitin-protein ligase RGLG3-like [Carex rostrata]